MITGINHITLATRDLDKSIDFYQTLLGIPLIARWKKGAYLSVGNLWLCLSYDKQAPKVPAEHYSHIAFSIDKNDFSYMEKKIADTNFTLWKENTSEGDSIYILDPDNHKLEIHASDLRSRIQYVMEFPYDDEMEIYEHYNSL